MKKLLLTLLSVQFVQFANADQIVCRGSDMTLKLSDKYDLEDGNFVMAHVWTAKYDQARYADLFAGLVAGVESISQMNSSVDQIVVDQISGELKFNLQDKSMQLVNSKVGTLSNSMTCKKTKGAPTVFIEMGVGNSMIR